MIVPDHSTLSCARNWLNSSNIMPKLLQLINQQLENKHLKVSDSPSTILDATIQSRLDRLVIKRLINILRNKAHEDLINTKI